MESSKISNHKINSIATSLNNGDNITHYIVAIVFSILLFVYPLYSAIVLGYLFIFLIMIKDNYKGSLLLLLSLQASSKMFVIIINRYLPHFFYGSFILVLFIMLLNIIIFDYKIPKVKFFDYLILLFSTILIISIFFVSTDKSYGIEKFILYITSLILMYVPVFWANKKSNLKVVIDAIFLFNCLLITLSILKLSGIEHHFETKYGNRFFVLEINPIWVARYLSFGILSNIYYIFQFKKNWLEHFGKIFILILISFFQIYLVFLTGSRGPLLALILALFLSILLVSKNKLLNTIFIVGMIVAGYIVLNYIVPEELLSRMISKDVSGQMTTIIRLLANLKAVSYFCNNKLFGIGFGSFQFGGGFLERLIYPHNIFSEILAETGIIGFSILSIILLKSIVMLKKLYGVISSNSYFFLLSLFIAGFANANLSGHLGANYYFWLALGLIYVTYRKEFEGKS